MNSNTRSNSFKLAGQRDTAPGDTCNLMIKCSRRSGHDIPSAVQSPANRRAHSLSIGLPEREPDSVSADPPAAAGQSLPEIWATRLNSLDSVSPTCAELIRYGVWLV